MMVWTLLKGPPMTTRAQIARLIDHTILKPETTAAQVDALIAEAAALGAYSVCVSPSLLPLEVPDTLHVATVCGFPSGAHATAVKAAEAAGADFVKTSTGFHPAGGASTHAVALMRATVGDRLGVKASGGIRTAADALAMVEAGANRLGLSASAAVLEGLEV